MACFSCKKGKIVQGKGFEPQFTGMIFVDRGRFIPVDIKRIDL
jgi:hypothetical protein